MNSHSSNKLWRVIIWWAACTPQHCTHSSHSNSPTTFICSARYLVFPSLISLSAEADDGVMAQNEGTASGSIIISITQVPRPVSSIALIPNHTRSYPSLRVYHPVVLVMAILHASCVSPEFARVMIMKPGLISYQHHHYHLWKGQIFPIIFHFFIWCECVHPVICRGSI